MGAAEQPHPPRRARPTGGSAPSTPLGGQAGDREPGTPPYTPTAQRRPKQGSEGRGSMPATLLFGGCVLLLMVAGLAASERNLRLAKAGALVISAPLLSASSMIIPDHQQQQQLEEGNAVVAGVADDSAMLDVLASAAASVGESLGADGLSVRPQQPAEQATSSQAAGEPADGQISSSGMSAAGSQVSRLGMLPPAGHASTPVLVPPAPPPKWKLRCAVVNNLVFHIDVMAGWTYSFQSAGCDVTVYQNERSLGIEDIMSSWHTGSFRKPELFPGEAGDYHIIILPTFRDQHAELIQYLLQLPRLKQQRYFLTQHNPDWLLNHPNVDILQQQLLAPLLSAAKARDAQQDGPGAGRAAAPLAAASVKGTGQLDAQPQQPLLRLQVATLAPCVSNYTLHFLRQMAFNITEGYTYAERVGSFRVRSNSDQGAAGEDNSEALRQWIDQAIDVEVPWLSPLVPWQPPALEPFPSSSAPAAAETRSQAEDKQGAKQLEGEARKLQRRLLTEAGSMKSEKEGGSSSGKDGSNEDSKEGPSMPPLPPPLGPPSNDKKADRWWLKAPAPPPPPPVGAEAVALLEELNRQRPHGDSGPRHVCIQGKLENSRRNYTAAFEAIRHPAVLGQLRSSGERLLLLGHRSKWETVVIPEEVQDVVVVLESLPYTYFFDTLSRCRAIMLAFATEEYYAKKSSSTIATALNVGVPLVAEQRTLVAYNFLEPDACFVYDDTIPGTAPRGDSSSESGKMGKESHKEAGKDGQASEETNKVQQRRLLLGKKDTTDAAGAVETEDGRSSGGGDEAKAAKKVADHSSSKQQQKSGKQQQQQQQGGSHKGDAAAVEDPQAGSYSAAILAALCSESSTAARLAVGKLKERVMRHNAEIAGAFMAATEQQYSPEERAADAAWWHERWVQRQMLAAAAASAQDIREEGDDSWPLQ